MDDVLEKNQMLNDKQGGYEFVKKYDSHGFKIM